MYSRILVTLDGSDLAEAALPAATEITDVLGGRMTLLNVCGLSEGNCDIYQSYLDMMAREISGGSRGKVSAVVVRGSAADEIIKYIKENKITLTVMATHGRSGISNWVIGSVAERVVREANRPVLLLRSQGKCTVSAEGILNRIIVPLDGSRMGEAALRFVVPMALKAKSEIVLLHIVEREYHFAAAVDTYVQIPYTEDEMKPLREKAQSYLDGVARRLEKKGLKVRKEIREGKPAESIIDYVGQSGIGTIAMSTRGRTGISRWVLGSVTDKIVHSSCARVMVVRPPDAA